MNFLLYQRMALFPEQCRLCVYVFETPGRHLMTLSFGYLTSFETENASSSVSNMVCGLLLCNLVVLTAEERRTGLDTARGSQRTVHNSATISAATQHPDPRSLVQESEIPIYVDHIRCFLIMEV